MVVEEFIWIYMPLIIAILEIFLSGKSIRKKRSIFGIISFVFILLMNLFAGYILIAILMGGWPTYVPHIMVGISSILLIIQIGLTSRSNKMKTFANKKK